MTESAERARLNGSLVTQSPAVFMFLPSASASACTAAAAALPHVLSEVQRLPHRGTKSQIPSFPASQTRAEGPSSVTLRKAAGAARKRGLQTRKSRCEGYMLFSFGHSTGRQVCWEAPLCKRKPLCPVRVRLIPGLRKVWDPVPVPASEGGWPSAGRVFLVSAAETLAQQVQPGR